MIDETGGRGFSTASPSDNARVFRRALRHSRHVRVLRIAIPVTLLLVVGGLTLWAWLDPMRSILRRLPAQIGGIAVSGSKITMAAPKLSGYTRDGRWYEFTARSAAQDITKPDVVELTDLNVKIEMQQKETMALTAAQGVLDRKSGILVLKRDILIVSSNGLEMRLTEAVIDTGSGDIVSSQPVQVKTQQATLNANGLEVLKGGEVITFTDGVTAVIVPDEAEASRENAVKP